MGLNKLMEQLPAIAFGAQEQFVDLVPGVLTKAIHLEVEATVDIAGGAASGTVVPEGILNMIDSVRIVHDGDEKVDLSGRLLAQLWRRHVRNMPTPTELANGNVQTTTVRMKFGVPFARGWLANPFDTVFPPLLARQEFRIFVEWNQAVNAGSVVAGTGALVAGGDRVVTFTDGPRIRIVQEYAEVGIEPMWAPKYTSFEVDRFTAADRRLQAEMKKGSIIDAILIASRDTATAAPTDALINDLTFRGASRRFIDSLRWDQFQDMDQEIYSGVDGLHRAGYGFYLLADGGKLGNAVNLDAIVNPLLEFDVNAPSGGNGQITVVLSELESIAGVTRQ